MLGVLLKKQLCEKLSYFRRDKKNIDYVGAILTLALLALMLFVIVEVFGAFVEKYTAIRMYGVADVRARQFEIMTLVYESVFLIGIISGVSMINRALFESDDRQILITLPVKASTVFLSKVISVYFKQTLTSLIATLPFISVFAAVTGQGAGYIALSVFAALLIPFASLAASSVLCMPYYYIKRFFQSKYLSLFIVITAIMFLLFWGYANVLDFMRTLMSTGEIKFFFSEKTMTAIINVTDKLVPANFIARFTLGIEAGNNFGILLAITVASAVTGLFVTSALFNKAMKIQNTRGGKIIFSDGKLRRRMSARTSLFVKEFETVLLTPDYAVEYFSVAAIMPLMVYFCMTIGKSLLKTLVFVENDFELAIFLTVLFGALTNTFPATNVSRDGRAFYMLKTLPLKITDVLAPKIAMNVTVSALSAGITAAVLAGKKFVSVPEGLFVFVVVMILSVAEILIATRKDLNKPRFSFDDDNVVRETNNNVSLIIVIGILLALVLGGIPLAVNVMQGLKGKNYGLFTYLFAGAGAVTALACAAAYAFSGIRKRFDALTEGD